MRPARRFFGSIGAGSALLVLVLAACGGFPEITELSLALGLSVALMIPAGAADLHEPHTNMTFDCDGTVELHFVNNQTGGAAAANITVLVNGGSTTISEGPTKVNQNVQHYHVDIDGGDTLSGRIYWISSGHARALRLGVHARQEEIGSPETNTYYNKGAPGSPGAPFVIGI